MGKKAPEHDKHAAGGPGKSARKGHVEADKSGNKRPQRQAGPVGMPGEGRRLGTQRRKPGKSEK